MDEAADRLLARIASFLLRESSHSLRHSPLTGERYKIMNPTQAKVRSQLCGVMRQLDGWAPADAKLDGWTAVAAKAPREQQPESRARPGKSPARPVRGSEEAVSHFAPSTPPRGSVWGLDHAGLRASSHALGLPATPVSTAKLGSFFGSPSSSWGSSQGRPSGVQRGKKPQPAAVEELMAFGQRLPNWGLVPGFWKGWRLYRGSLSLSLERVCRIVRVRLKEPYDFAFGSLDIFNWI